MPFFDDVATSFLKLNPMRKLKRFPFWADIFALKGEPDASRAVCSRVGNSGYQRATWLWQKSPLSDGVRIFESESNAYPSPRSVSRAYGKFQIESGCKVD